ncbi:unnamed protein product [Microthlaspi erraticum]|uniref:AP2/ERF domain-containing protein n=1 Tax=Microthlaspi erraticum TaxID=1685480 RepID=A0A6D2KEY8_9BRAS|nr:unnamed protein product [Microthlaspi erraticum]
MIPISNLFLSSSLSTFPDPIHTIAEQTSLANLKESEKHKVEYEVHGLVVNRDSKFTNFVERTFLLHQQMVENNCSVSPNQILSRTVKIVGLPRQWCLLLQDVHFRALMLSSNFLNWNRSFTSFQRSISSRIGGLDTSHVAARAYDRAAIKCRCVEADINFSKKLIWANDY